MRTGFAELPLHGGSAPRWLFSRMVLLSREVLGHVVAEYGPQEVLRRFSDPYWFQAFGCVLGFDWHSSGVTTTVCGAVKEAVRGNEKDFGFHAAGGKGATSRKTPAEITAACEAMSREPAGLVYASRMAAKVDSAAVQDGYQLYHHAFFFTPRADWCVVQQGMSDATGTARRYHWLSESLPSFVSEPHAAVCCDARGETWNLVAAENETIRGGSAELARQRPEQTLKALRDLPRLEMPGCHDIRPEDIRPAYLEKILLATYERSPEDFETLLGMPGVGAKTLRALSLVAEVIHGAPVSTRDPARFAFAHGGKDGHPFPVDRETYDRTIRVLRDALDKARLDRSEKTHAFRRLAGFTAGERSKVEGERSAD